MNRFRPTCRFLPALFAILSVSGLAAAAEPSAADKETARSLLVDGRAKLEAKDFEGAFSAFRAAHEIMGVPTTGLDMAKAQAALGKLVEARDTALSVARIPPEATEPQAFVDARAEAAALAQSLLPRIPSIVLRVSGPTAPTVTVDGADVPPAALGLPRKVNPGAHKVVVTAEGYAATERSVTVAEGATESIAIAMQAGAEPMAPPPALAPPPASAQPMAPAETSPAGPDQAATPSDGVPSWVWVAGGAGVVAATIGVVFAIDYAGAQSTISEDCPTEDAEGRLVCSREKYDNAEDVAALASRRDRAGGLAVGLGALGAVAIGAAVIGLVMADDSKADEKQTAVSPWLSANAAGITVAGGF